MTVLMRNAPNFRSVDAPFNRHGERLSAPLFYRSGDLSQLDDGDVNVLSQCGIGLVIDLRSRYERQRRPNRFPTDHTIRVIEGDIRIDLRAANGSLGDLLLADPTPDGARHMMARTYVALAKDALLPLLAPVVQAMTETPGATLVLCTAGKDRTGCLVATLLHLLDVDHGTILADYLLTNQRVDLDAMAATSDALLKALFDVQLPREALDVVNRVEASYLRIALDTVVATHGSLDAWIAAAGITPALLQAFRQRYRDNASVTAPAFTGR